MNNGFLVRNGLSFKGLSAAPSNPQEGDIYFDITSGFQTYVNGAWFPLVGSAGGASVNLIGMNSTFQSTNLNDINAEGSTGNWLAYADAAGVSPIDMTGGSPTVTIARTITVGEVLNGSGSFKIVKDAANRQGEGASVITNIPLGYRGKRTSINFPFKIISGSLVQNDLKLYAYDVTNSQVLTPEHNDVFYSSTLKAAIDIPLTCSQIRFGFHFASTSTVAVTFSFDDIYVGSQSIVTGSSVTDWVFGGTTIITATTTAPTKGTVVTDEMWWRRVGDSMEVRIGYRQSTAGTAGSGDFLFQIPTGYTIDVTKLKATALAPTGSPVPELKDNGVGSWYMADVDDNQATLGSVEVYDSTRLRFSGGFFNAGSSNPLTLGSGANFLNKNATSFVASFTVPISGWSSNTTVVNSGIIRISDILANGTRITGTPPTQLGEYRSYLRNAGAKTFTETNGAPGSTPSATNGVKLYLGAQSFGSADANNEPTKYNIFVGKNKSIRAQFYKNTGRTGFVDIDPQSVVTTEMYGYFQNYDPSTGIYTITPHTFATQNVHFSGVDENGADLSADIYFDLFVADNDFQIQLAQERSEVFLTGTNGHGSVNTHIRRFSTVKSNTGADITYADSATLGASFTINTTGLYSMYYNDNYSAASIGYHGFSLNSTQLTTSIQSITEADRLFYVHTDFDYNGGGEAAVTVYLNPGDIVRPHDDGLSNAGAPLLQFKIIKIG